MLHPFLSSFKQYLLEIFGLVGKASYASLVSIACMGSAFDSNTFSIDSLTPRREIGVPNLSSSHSQFDMIHWRTLIACWSIWKLVDQYEFSSDKNLHSWVWDPNTHKTRDVFFFLYRDMSFLCIILIYRNLYLSVTMTNFQTVFLKSNDLYDYFLVWNLIIFRFYNHQS